ncbi:MAG: methyltransferase [Desulfobulbus sp.]|nr:methyltransferase [Desulfobulbus sp.]
MLKLVLFWGGWCALHSLLITTTVRRWIEGKGGPWLGLYRLVYIGVAGVSLLPVLLYTAWLPQQPLPLPPFWLHIVRGVLLFYATVLFIGGLRAYDLQAFLGLRQWREFRQGKVRTPPVLNTSGILGYLRHPWYSGGIAFLWGLPGLTDVTLVTRLMLSGYLVIGAFLEERKMENLLGDVYREYCRTTPMFVPWRFWARNQR